MKFLKSKWFNILILGIVFIAVGLLLIFLQRNQFDESATHKLVEQNISQIVKKTLVVIIASDGMGSYLLGENSPYINSVIEDQNTSYTLKMQTIEQSETLPSFTSMVTGLTQENHKVDFNSVDLLTPQFQSRTIFDFALENHFKPFVFVGKEKLIYLLGSKTGDSYLYKDVLSSDSLQDIDDLVNPISDNVFAFIHLKDLDSVGHLWGWNSDKQQDSLKTLDNNISLIVNDLNSEFAAYERFYIFTADHGGEGLDHSSGCENCRTIPLIVNSQNTDRIYILSENQYDIYDVACVALDLMGVKVKYGLDCER